MFIKKNVLNILAISNVLVMSMPFALRHVGDAFLFPLFESISLMVFQVVISMPFTLRYVGDAFLFPLFESISLMVFQVFLISHLYFSNVGLQIAAWKHICSFLIFYCMF